MAIGPTYGTDRVRSSFGGADNNPIPKVKTNYPPFKITAIKKFRLPKSHELTMITYHLVRRLWLVSFV